MAKRWQNEHKKRGATRDGDNIVYEHYGVTEAVYYRGLNLVAQKIDGYISHYLYDQKGSVTGGANRTGTTEYDAFGVQRTSDKLPYNPFRYNGEYYDQESGLIYLRNRYYDPATGRFMTEDPAKDGLNWYVYCGGNPVNFADPSGLAVYRKWVDNYITNMRDLSEQQVSNISSVLNANSSGFVTEEAMLANIVQNGGILREEKKLDPVQVSQNGNSVNVDLYVSYSGDLANRQFGDTGYTFSEISTQGIEECWSGTVGRTIVTTNVHENSLIYRNIVIKINEGPYEKSHTHTTENGEIHLYYDTVGKITFNPIRLKNAAGHEIGHRAFKLNDNLYDEAHSYVRGHGITNIDSIMYMTSSAVIQNYPVDLAMMLYNASRGFKTSLFYSERPSILDLYAPGWRLDTN